LELFLVKQDKYLAAVNNLVKEMVTKYLGSERPAGKFIYQPAGENWESDLLPSSIVWQF
jgi:hypothetical protein